MSLGVAVTAFMEDLAIRKLFPATLKPYQSDLAAVSALLGPHDGGWPVSELAGPVLRSAFAVFAVDHARGAGVEGPFHLEGAVRRVGGRWPSGRQSDGRRAPAPPRGVGTQTPTGLVAPPGVGPRRDGQLRRP